MRRTKKLGVTVWHLLDRFVNEGCMGRAASLAYANLLSLVPLLIVGVTIISWFPNLQVFVDKIQGFVLQNFVADSAHVVQKYITSFVDNVRYLSVTSIAMFMVVSVLMIYNVSRTFNAIWHTHEHRALWKSFLIYIAILFISPVLMGVGFAFSSYVFSLPIYAGLIPSQVSKWLLFVLSNVMNIVLFTLLNWILPAVRVPFKAACIAGLVSALLFEIAKYGFSLYIYHVATYRLLYGALATVPVFLIWLYVSWITILFGTLIGHFSVVGLRRRWQPFGEEEDQGVDFTPKERGH